MKKKNIAILLFLLGHFVISFGQTVVFEKNYGGSLYESSWDVTTVQSGGYAVIGSSISFSNGGTDYYLIRTDNGGNEVWSANYGGSGNNSGMSLQATNDGGFIIGGTEVNGATGDCWLLKVDSAGNELWDTYVGGAGDDYVRDIIQVSDGGYVFCGFTDSYGSGGHDVYIGKLNSSGTLLWDNYFGGTSDDEGWTIQPTQDGGYIVGGWTESFGSGMADAYAIKVDASGNEQWSNYYGGTNDDAGMSIMELSSGEFGFIGNTRSYGAGLSDAWFIMLDSGGSLSWDQTYGGSGEDYGRSFVVNPGGFTVAGYTQSFGAGGDDIYLINTDWNGVEVNNFQFGGTGNDEATKIKTDGMYFYVVGATTSYTNGQEDYYFAKLLPESVEVDEISENKLKLYPNPATDKVYIESDLLIEDVTIIDFLGRIVEIDRTGLAEINVSSLTPGAYVVLITTENGLVSRIPLIKKN